MSVDEALASVEAAVMACRRAALRRDAAAVESGAEDLAFSAAALRQALDMAGKDPGVARADVVRIATLVASARPWLSMPLEFEP